MDRQTDRFAIAYSALSMLSLAKNHKNSSNKKNGGKKISSFQIITSKNFYCRNSHFSSMYDLKGVLEDRTDGGDIISDWSAGVVSVANGRTHG